MQSLNEELATVNAELQSKMTDLAHTNADMNNLLAGTKHRHHLRGPAPAHPAPYTQRKRDHQT